MRVLFLDTCIFLKETPPYLTPISPVPWGSFNEHLTGQRSVATAYAGASLSSISRKKMGWDDYIYPYTFFQRNPEYLQKNTKPRYAALRPWIDPQPGGLVTP